MDHIRLFSIEKLGNTLIEYQENPVTDKGKGATRVA
jgi:hypothetical protein